MIEITQDASGITLPLHVQPKASADRLAGEHDGRLKVSVTAAPEDGKANESVVRLLARKLGVPRNTIRILSGHASRRKIVHIDGITAEQLHNALGLLPPG